MLVQNQKLFRLYTTLFFTSLFLMCAHVVDDYFVGESNWWGVSGIEFILFNIQLYLFVPPFGWLLARRGHAAGFIITFVYGLMALYGAGINHVKHLMGDFRGSQLLPAILKDLGINIGDVQGHGMLTGVYWLFGLGNTPPHSHSLLSTAIVFVGIGVNTAFLITCVLGFIAWRHYPSAEERRAASVSAV